MEAAVVKLTLEPGRFIADTSAVVVSFSKLFVEFDRRRKTLGSGFEVTLLKRFEALFESNLGFLVCRRCERLFLSDTNAGQCNRQINNSHPNNNRIEFGRVCNSHISRYRKATQFGL